MTAYETRKVGGSGFLAIGGAILLALFMASCVSTGRNFDESKVSQIQKGVTTKEEIRKMFGKPESGERDRSSDGSSVWVYSYQVLNLALADDVEKEKSLFIWFDGDIVSQYSYEYEE